MPVILTNLLNINFVSQNFFTTDLYELFFSQSVALNSFFQNVALNRIIHRIQKRSSREGNSFLRVKDRFQD